MDIILQQDKLNVVTKQRSNMFDWKGQFTPQFVEYMLDCFASEHTIVADPFLGSGTVLCESIKRGNSCLGFDINPSAYYMSKFFEYSMLSEDERNAIIEKSETLVETLLGESGDVSVFISTEKDYRCQYHNLLKFASSIAEHSTDDIKPYLINMLFFCEKDKKKSVQNSVIANMAQMKANILSLPYTNSNVKVHLGDARNICIDYKNCVDLILTSPPYINVFNYHQNYRGIIECFGYNVLNVANSEMGANRKHRSNRFKTVVQYSMDIGQTIYSSALSLKIGGRMVFVVGRESCVKKTAFYNSKILKELVALIPNLTLESESSRQFKNRFGATIIEDILIIKKSAEDKLDECPLIEFENVGYSQIQDALGYAEDDVKSDLMEILQNRNIQTSPIFNQL